MKTEVYSWRLERNLKAHLEREARLRKTSVSALLDLAVRDLLKKTGVDADEDEEQRRLQQGALKCVGALAGDNPHRSETGRQAVRKRLRTRYAR